MRVAELERWLWQHGWQPEPHGRRGSGRAWTHPLFRERLTYHDPHGRDRRELRPDVVARILDDLEHAEPLDTRLARECAACLAAFTTAYRESA